MATYIFRRNGDGLQRTTASANGTRSNTRTFYPGQRGYARNARLAARQTSSITGVSAEGDK